MQRIPLTDEQGKQLAEANGTVEFTDATGNVIGEYRRVIDCSALANNPDWPSDEELERMENNDEFVPAEVIDELLRKYSP